MLDRRRLSFALGAVVVLDRHHSSQLRACWTCGAARVCTCLTCSIRERFCLKPGIVVSALFDRSAGRPAGEPTYTSHKVSRSKRAPRYVKGDDRRTNINRLHDPMLSPA